MVQVKLLLSYEFLLHCECLIIILLRYYFIRYHHLILCWSICLNQKSPSSVKNCILTPFTIRTSISIYNNLYYKSLSLGLDLITQGLLPTSIKAHSSLKNLLVVQHWPDLGLLLMTTTIREHFLAIVLELLYFLSNSLLSLGLPNFTYCLMMEVKEIIYFTSMW